MRFATAYNTPVCLLPDAKLGDDGAVTLDVLVLQVVEKAATMAYHLVHAKTAMGVFLVDLQVLGELIDALREDGDLDLGGTGVVLAAAIGLDDRGLLLLCDHGFFSFLEIVPAGPSNGMKGPDSNAGCSTKPGGGAIHAILAHLFPVVKGKFNLSEHLSLNLPSKI